MNRQQASLYNCGASSQLYRAHDQESSLVALALLLGPETEYQARVRATQLLTRQGPTVLPLLLTTLSTHPEITTPPWPWWPPQYEHCSRLLLHLAENAQLSLEALLQYPSIQQSPGPVLWASVIEAAGLVSHTRYEPLLCQGLTTPWATVRYAAAMELAKLAGEVSLLDTTLELLYTHQCPEETIPVQLTTAYALLRHGDNQGIEALMRLLHAEASLEARKAAAFVLAVSFQPQEPAVTLSSAQRERLTRLLILSLQDQEEVAMHAAQALGSIASPCSLRPLYSLLYSPRSHVQLAALVALEELADRKAIRSLLQHATPPTGMVALLRAEVAEVRRQACYTLAAFGGTYAAAVLGTTLLNNDHPAQLAAIEGLRQLHGVLRAPTCTDVVRWLLYALHQEQAEMQITALDSLSHLLWQAQRHRQQRAFYTISTEVLHDGMASQLLNSSNAWVRQKAEEVVNLLACTEHSLNGKLHSSP